MKNYNEMFIIRTWEEFREMCREDASNWYYGGYKASELTTEDIVDEYDESFFTAAPEDAREGERAFSAAEVAEWTLSYMLEMEGI